MELLCQEGYCIKRAFEDPVLLNDSRVLDMLLDTECKYLPSPNYFKCVQSEVKPFMRKIVANWMLEVCEEQRCEEEVFPLAMNYLDRILSVVDVKKSQLQLIGATCMFVSSKLKETLPLTGDKIVIYTDYSITLEQLMDMELLVLARLGYDLSAITPHDYLEQLLSRLPGCSQNKEVKATISRHAQTFIQICATEYTFSVVPPSIIASAALSAAVTGLAETACLNTDLIKHNLCLLSGIDLEVLINCQQQMELALSSSMTPPTSSSSSQQDAHAHPSHKQDSDDIDGHPHTPTDVRDIHC